jgi:carbon-monoxide dehydrogenase medium subunit
MKPPRFAYHAPRSIEEALALLARTPNARALAGGQSLMPMLNFRLAQPDALIDLNTVPELAYIREADGEIRCGAMTRQREIEFSRLVHEKLPLLAEATLHVGHRQTRNRGTIGGSLCHLDPSAEMPTIAQAMDARLVVRSSRGVRELTMEAFATGMMSTSLAADELLTEIRFKPWSATHRWGFLEFARRHGDFAVVSVAALLEIDAGGTVSRASLTLGGVAPTPTRVSAAEQALLGTRAEAAAIDAAARAAGAIEALEEPTYPAWYRQRLASTLTQRALRQALDRN